MRIKNMTSKTLKIYFYLPAWDPREDITKPGETSDDWLYLDEGDILETREKKEKPSKTKRNAD